MILDHLSAAYRYTCLHPAFDAAFQFLNTAASRNLGAGRHNIVGEGLYAMVVRGEGKGENIIKLEQHRRYIDIQFQAAGSDRIGWAALDSDACKGYDAVRDVQFPEQPATTIVTVPDSHFGIFFPDDAHAPMLGKGVLHKIVVKVALV